PPRPRRERARPPDRGGSAGGAAAGPFAHRFGGTPGTPRSRLRGGMKVGRWFVTIYVGEILFDRPRLGW
ncbi:MAG TPA: hypothetical protein VG455_03420, partial [Acidimicrobiales bacterium]|nr:hypothetical protein [Acidimicrobiales bacterium]